MPTPAYKTCLQCQRSLPAASFHKSGTRRDELQIYCKPCNRDRVKAWRKANRDKVSETNRRYRTNNPEKNIAHRRLHKALRDGRLTKPSGCEDCGLAASPEDLQAHHEDYSKPLDVEWLCRCCHMRRHHLAEKTAADSEAT